MVAAVNETLDHRLLAGATRSDPINRAVCSGIARDAEISERALRLLGVLKRCNARSADEAVCDAVLAREAGVPVRDVIDLAEELAAIDIAVVASCGTARHGRSGKGRFMTTDPRLIREYAGRLHDRAGAIHGRAKTYSDLAARLDAKRMPVDSTGQGRLNYA